MTCLKTTFVLEAYNVLIIFLYSNASEQNISSCVIIRLLEKCSKGRDFIFSVDYTVLRALSLWLIILFVLIHQSLYHFPTPSVIVALMYPFLRGLTDQTAILESF